MFRPPILQAASTLGIKDADVARLLNLTPVTVSEWARNIRPVPPARQAHLYFAVTNLLDQLRQAVPSTERDARRLKVAVEVAERWLDLAREEIGKGLIQEIMGLSDEDRLSPVLAARHPRRSKYDRLPGLASREIAKAKKAKRGSKPTEAKDSA